MGNSFVWERGEIARQGGLLCEETILGSPRGICQRDGACSYSFIDIRAVGQFAGEAMELVEVSESVAAFKAFEKVMHPNYELCSLSLSLSF